MDLSLFEEIGKSSKKAFFVYQIKKREFEYLSPAAATLCERKQVEIKESPEMLLEAVHPQDRESLAASFQELLSGKAQEPIFRLQLVNGVVKHVKVDVYPLTNSSKEVYALAGQAEDISAQVQQVAYLQEFGQKKNSALEIVAHDLQSPLSIVKGIASLLEHDLQEKMYDEISTYIHLIHRAHDDCSNLIKSVLNDEHLKSPLVQPKKERLDAVEQVKAVANDYRLAPNVEQEIVVSSVVPKIEASLDQVKFAQIINNLISNSIKFTPPKGKIAISLREENRQLVIVHQDTGIGIPEALQPFLFERYTRASREGLKGEKSSGIGLSIVQKLVEIQGGKIWFESRENQGTTFFITFPLEEV